MHDSRSYHLAQRALADLKAAVREVLHRGSADGMTNAEVGRALGIYAGHKGHEGHISRTILAFLEDEGVAQQDPETKRWRVRQDQLDPGASSPE